MVECPGIHTLAEMKDGFLARIRVPGGQLKTENLRQIARITQKYGSGIIDLTNRANLQIRSLKKQHQQNLISDLLACDLITKDPEHDRLRNIVIDPLSGLVNEVIDCGALVRHLDHSLSLLPCKAQISPKFSIVLDGGGPSQISGIGHDLAFVAKKGSNPADPLFELLITGHKTLITLKASELTDKTMSWINTLVDLAKPDALRMKNLVQSHGLKTILAQLTKTQTNKEIESGPKKTVVPLAGFCRQKNTEQVAINLTSPTGRLFDFQMLGLAELAEHYSETDEIRLTSWQSVILPHINQDHICEVWEKSEALGLLTQEVEQNLQILSCAGSEGCSKGGFETKIRALEIREALSDMAFPNLTTIHLSACEKGCASRSKVPYLVLQRQQEQSMRLYVNAAPDTTERGKEIEQNKLIPELKKLI